MRTEFLETLVETARRLGEHRVLLSYLPDGTLDVILWKTCEARSLGPEKAPMDLSLLEKHAKLLFKLGEKYGGMRIFAELHPSLGLSFGCLKGFEEAKSSKLDELEGLCRMMSKTVEDGPPRWRWRLDALAN